MRTNRKQFPRQLREKSADSNRGDSTFMYRGDITVLKWLDNKDVRAMSTHISNGLTMVKRRCGNTSSKIDVPCPEIISDYNQFMGGVDLTNQFICYYSVGRRNIKWWRKVAWRLHDHAICNAHVIYKYNNRTSLKKSTVSIRPNSCID